MSSVSSSPFLSSAHHPKHRCLSLHRHEREPLITKLFCFGFWASRLATATHNKSNSWPPAIANHNHFRCHWINTVTMVRFLWSTTDCFETLLLLLSIMIRLCWRTVDWFDTEAFTATTTPWSSLKQVPSRSCPLPCYSLRYVESTYFEYHTILTSMFFLPSPPWPSFIIITGSTSQTRKGQPSPRTYW